MSTEAGSDPIGDFQRWLMKAGARSIGRDVAGRVRSTFGGGAKDGDVWDTATTEDPVDEPPECQWCPICRAARKYRDSGGSTATLGGQFAGVSDTLAGLTRDAFSLFDAAMRPPQRPGDPRNAGQRPADQRPAASEPAPAETSGDGNGQSDHGHSDNGTVIVGSGIGWPTVVHPQHEDHEPANEGGDREERGEPGDRGAGGGGDEQVERSAE